VRKKFTQDQLNARGLIIYRDGKPITVSELNKGDEISATVVSQRPPQIVTEQDVDATLAKTEPAPAKTEAMPAKTESTAAKTEPAPAAKTEPAPANTEPPAVVAQATPPMATTPPATTAAPAPTPVESSGMGTMWYVILAVVIAAVLFLVMRQRKEENPSP
jgi:hypothetical protein